MITISFNNKNFKLKISCPVLEIQCDDFNPSDFFKNLSPDEFNSLFQEYLKGFNEKQNENLDNLNNNPENINNNPVNLNNTGSGSGASPSRSRKSTYSKKHFCDKCGQPYTATHNRQLYCTKCKENSKLSKEVGTKRKAVIPNITEKDIMDPMGLTK